MGYNVVSTVYTGAEAVEHAAGERVDLVLMDIELRGQIDGVEAVQRIQQRDDIPVVYVTAHSDAGTLKRAETTHPYGFLRKPLQDSEIRKTVKRALATHLNLTATGSREGRSA
jgi:CheY-like chemotaxis protein